MKKWLKIIPAVLIVTVILTSGCITSDGVTAAKIKADMLQSTEEIESYKFSTTITSTSTMTGDSDGINMETSSTGEGSADLVNKKLMMEQTTEVTSMLGQEPVEGTSAIYFIDDILYMGIENMALGSVEWLKKNNTGTTWDSYDQMEMQAVLLEVSEVERLDDEVVNGIDCYVLRIIPDLEKYYEIMMNQQGQDTSTIPPGTDFSELIEGWMVKQWIAKDTNYFIKTYNKMTMHIFTMSLTYETEILYSDYNSPVNIELPADAEDAEWMPENHYI